MSEDRSATLPPAGGDFQDAMERFRAQFAAQVPARLAEARERLAACRAAPLDDAPLRELHRVLHKLAGSAGTFGLPALGDASYAIELQLEALLARPQRSAADFDGVAAQIDALALPASSS